MVPPDGSRALAPAQELRDRASEQLAIRERAAVSDEVTESTNLRNCMRKTVFEMRSENGIRSGAGYRRARLAHDLEFVRCTSPGEASL